MGAGLFRSPEAGRLLVAIVLVSLVKSSSAARFWVFHW